jgi:nicotinamide mononucleotide adenylyltransferase
MLPTLSKLDAAKKGGTLILMVCASFENNSILNTYDTDTERIQMIQRERERERERESYCP